MLKEQQELLDSIRAWLAARPEDFGLFLRTIADESREYEARQMKLRSCEADHALHHAVGAIYLPKARRNFYFMFPIAFSLFPRGDTNRSEVEKRFWGQFLALAQEKDNKSVLEWIRLNYGPAQILWWRDIVEPAMLKEEKNE